MKRRKPPRWPSKREAQRSRQGRRHAARASPHLFKAVQDEFKRVDILINNAGITRDDFFLTMRPQAWSELIDLHLNATFHCTKAVIRGMCGARRAGDRQHRLGIGIWCPCRVR